MCIICNVTENFEVAEEYLSAFADAQKAMSKAAHAMLAVSQTAKLETRKQYDHTHKTMVKLIREWNTLEHSREHAQSK